MRHRRRPAEYITPVLGLALVGLVCAWLLVNLIQAPDQFFRVFLIGFTNGGLYALVALGYTLVYGILELINFAHGDVFMLGAMMAAVLIGEFGLTESSSSDRCSGDSRLAGGGDAGLRPHQRRRWSASPTSHSVTRPGSRR